MPRLRKTARHAKPSVTAPLLAAGGLTTALVALDATVLAGSASAGSEPSVATFERLAQCESGGNWSTNTGNGYYGGLQFSAGTWRALGFGGLPHQASKATQIAAGQKLQARSGWGQWPACSRKLGLYGSAGTTTSVADRASRTRTAAAPRPAGQTAFAGTVTTASSKVAREDVRAWQARMRQRGWRITVDGRFGPQSASVAQRFAAEKHLALAPGSLNATVYGAAWTLPTR